MIVIYFKLENYLKMSNVIMAKPVTEVLTLEPIDDYDSPLCETVHEEPGTTPQPRLQDLPPEDHKSPHVLTLEPVDDGEEEWSRPLNYTVDGHVMYPCRICTPHSEFEKRDIREKWLCHQTGGIRIEANREKLKNINWHRQQFRDGVWAAHENVTYTIGPIDDRVPTEDEVLALSLEGLILKGTIVCKGGSTMKADVSNEVRESIHGFWNYFRYVTPLVKRYNLLSEIHKRRSQSFPYPRRMWVEEQAPLTGFFDRICSVKKTDFTPPSGEYKKIDVTTKWNEYGTRDFTLCDEPDCCRMGHIVLMMCRSSEAKTPCFYNPAFQNSVVPEWWSNSALEFIKGRAMYRKKDEINGNFDICYDCLQKKAKPF